MLLGELSKARGVSGNESAVRELIQGAVQDHVDECRVDTIGNLICLKRTRSEGERWPRSVMLSAHMDEIGFIVTGINSDGTLRFAQVGGLDDRILLSKQVLVGEDAVPGVIGYRPIHLISPADRQRVADMSKAAIDVGATSRASAEKLVNVGDYVTFLTSYEELTQDGLRVVKGKSFDDRAGCAVLIEALKGDYAFDLYGVFTVQEEVGLRGASVAAYAVAPDVAISLEGTICADLPTEKDISPVTEMGKGPAITLMDRSFVADRRLVDLLVGAAEAEGIPYQFKRASAGGTDSGAIHLAREGVPSVTVAVPCRYIHAPVSLLSLSDLEAMTKLIVAALHRLERGLGS